MDDRERDDGRLTPGEYCRAIESYLCQKNGGHLVRLVGPAFETVRRWAAHGIPLKVAFRGIDRCVERRHAKGVQRRPVRIEFCEADVRDAFDEWRRAVGVPAAGDEASAVHDGDAACAGSPRRGPSLTSHLDRVLLKLTSFLAHSDAPAALRDLVERDLREIDGLRRVARGLRGTPRDQLLTRLRDLDAGLQAEVASSANADLVGELRAAAAAELDTFRHRMTDAAWERALEAAVRQALRERLQLPRLALE